MRGEKFSGHERANALKQGGRRRKWSRRHRASPGGKRPAMRSDLDRIVERIAFWTAMAGGGALIVALVLTVVSIVGRGLISAGLRSEEHTSELQSLMRISYAVFCLKKKNTHIRE